MLEIGKRGELGFSSKTAAIVLLIGMQIGLLTISLFQRTAARIGWLPSIHLNTKTVSHISANLRYAQPDDDRYRFTSSETCNPVFNGGEVVASYILTGESRPYSVLKNRILRINPEVIIVDRSRRILQLSYACWR
jgi:hypothetical protein